MNRGLVIALSLIFLCQAFRASPARSNLSQFPSAATLGRYVLSESYYWIAYNKTVQQLKNEGYDASGDASWLLQVNYTRLGYSFRSQIVNLSWPFVTTQNVEREYDLSVTACRIMDDGSVGEKLGSFIRTNQPARLGLLWTNPDPEFGVGFNPSAFAIGNNFSESVLDYTVSRTEVLTNTPWGQNDTYLLHGSFTNSSHSYQHVVWCDTDSGIALKRVMDSITPMFVSREEHRIIETGVAWDSFEVVNEGKIYEISADTNSTVNSFAFDADTKKVTVVVNGSTGSTGKCNMTIPKNFVPVGHSFEVRVDDKKTDYVLTEDVNNYYLYVEYQHSTHTITISLVTGAIWTQWWFSTIVVLIVALAATAIFFKKRKR